LHTHERQCGVRLAAVFTQRAGLWASPCFGFAQTAPKNPAKQGKNLNDPQPA
jgi:hypothetical protein